MEKRTKERKKERSVSVSSELFFVAPALRKLVGTV
jgi:hypothetical protein